MFHTSVVADESLMHLINELFALTGNCFMVITLMKNGDYCATNHTTSLIIL